MADPSSENNVEVNEILSEELTWSEKQLFKKLGIFSAGDLDNFPAWELRRKLLLNTGVNHRNPQSTTVNHLIKSSNTSSPNCKEDDHDDEISEKKKDLRLSTMKVQLASKVAAEARCLVESNSDSKKVPKKVNGSSKKLAPKSKKQEKKNPSRVGALRKKFLADQRKATLSKNKEKETEDDDIMKTTLFCSESSITSRRKRKICSSMTNSPEVEDFRASRKKARVATLENSHPMAIKDEPLKENLKEKNMGGMIKSKQCCGVIGSSCNMVCSSLKVDCSGAPIAKPVTTATLKRPPRRDAPKKLVQETNMVLPKKVTEEDPEEAAERLRREREASRQALELMELNADVYDNFQVMQDFMELTGCRVFDGFGPDCIGTYSDQYYFDDKSSCSSCVTEELEEGEIS
ncbi:OLC1v1035394C1 [Oldenlandia corymbosa var. corymbosa]|uniref:OLC1v1035394C1 n=1 Tax=Oldenlandia corymbosa var. corymbosa TaxID=529605 RepID=A0AAV1CU76_OLDCO|nr:OLC1v1035394C1 [Oldenlandia corymbosa var. corymbosa]